MICQSNQLQAFANGTTIESNINLVGKICVQWQYVTENNIIRKLLLNELIEAIDRFNSYSCSWRNDWNELVVIFCSFQLPTNKEIKEKRKTNLRLCSMLLVHQNFVIPTNLFFHYNRINNIHGVLIEFIENHKGMRFNEFFIRLIRFLQCNFG